MTTWDEAVQREVEHIRRRLWAIDTHHVAMATNACIYCGITRAQLIEADEVPTCTEVMESKPRKEMTGLASIVGSTGPLELVVPGLEAVERWANDDPTAPDQEWASPK